MEGVEVIIFDEYSMQSQEHVYDMERRFAVSQSDPERRELPYGGRHVIYFGDCYQLPPPLSLAVYDELHTNDKFYAWRKKGLDIWRSFDSFVELVENVRILYIFTQPYLHPINLSLIMRRSVGTPARSIWQTLRPLREKGKIFLNT
jgi:hypothetical protein